MDTPFYSICKLGKQRFFWAAWASYEALCDHQVIDSGYATTREEADERARAAVGPSGNDYGRAGFAEGYHRLLAARRRIARLASKPAVTTDTAAAEYVYAKHHHGPWEFADRPPPGWDEPYYEAHRIIKRTKKSVFVDSLPIDSWQQQRITEHPEEMHMHRFDRETLERNEGVQAERGWWNPRFYIRIPTQPAPQVPLCLAALGLDYDCTRRDIQSAYRRKAREMHPDNGGDHEAFIALQAAYEEALRLRPA